MLSVKEKLRNPTVAGEVQGDERKQTAVRVVETVKDDVKTGLQKWTSDKSSIRGLVGIRHKGGVNLIIGFCTERGNLCFDEKA